MAAIRNTLAAAILALSASPALAHEEHGVAPRPTPPPYAAPYVAPMHAARPPAPVLLPVEWAPRWGVQVRLLQADYRRLERDRDRFYASWRGNPHAQRHFEAWYAARRAELDRRHAWLAERREHRGPGGHLAWNGEREGRGPGSWDGWRDRD